MIDRAPPFAVHVDAVGRAQQLVARVIHRAAASHVVLQILRGEGGQKLSLEVQVVHQLAFKLGKLRCSTCDVGIKRFSDWRRCGCSAL